MLTFKAEDRATRIGGVIGTLLVLVIAAVIAVDVASAVLQL